VAYNVYFKVVINEKKYYSNRTPWRCDICHKDPEVLLKMSIDYDTMIICDKCLHKAKKLITDKKKDLKK
jgi:hypothetical protein